jgi:hypothetical protein
MANQLCLQHATSTVSVGIFYMPQFYDMGQTALLPLRRKACRGFFRLKNPTASAGFEPEATADWDIANFTSRTHKLCWHNCMYDSNVKKLNIYNALIKSSLLYGSETWRLTENNKRWVEATEMDALRRSSRISRKETIRNVTIRQQIGLEETII